MDEQTKKLQGERYKLFNDFYNNIIPERMPVQGNICLGYVAGYAKQSLIDVQYDYSLIKDAFAELCDLTYSDTVPMFGGADSAMYNQSLGSQVYKMGKSGFLQHPNAVAMYQDEYDLFIKDPMAAIVETFIPRIYTQLNPENPYNLMKAYYIAKKAEEKDMNAFMQAAGPVIDKKGWYMGSPRGSRGHSLAPMDFIADQLRSMSEISKDVRRCPEKIVEACDAIYPYIFALQTPTNPHPEGAVSTPLHMPTYMREKDFVNIWLPSYKRLLEEWASIGVRVSAFMETDWDRYYDIVLDAFPAGTQLRFETGDPQKIKDKLGKKFIIGQLYPLDYITNGTPERAVDKAKELLDIMLPGGGFMFGFGKYPIVYEDVKLDNYIAVMDFVRDYAVYKDEAGQKYGTPLNSEGFKFDLTDRKSVV